MNTLEQKKFGRLIFSCALLAFLICSNSCATTDQVVGQKRTKLETCPNPVYYEDFSNVEVVSIPEGWIGGSTFAVKEGYRGRKELTTVKHDRSVKHSFLIPNIDFPQDFKSEILIKQSYLKYPSRSPKRTFEFNIGNLNFSIQRTYIDIKYRVWVETYKGWLGDSRFEIRTSRQWSTGHSWDLPSERQLFILEKNGDVFKLFANGHQLAVLRKPDFQEATSISFRCKADGTHLEIYKIQVCELISESTVKETKVETRKRPSKLSVASFYYEDFSNVESGLIPEGWIGGDTFAVKESQRFRGRKVLSIIKDGKQSFKIPEIEFPEDFKLEFEMILLKGCCDKMILNVGNLDIVIHTNGESRLGNTDFRVMTDEHFARKFKASILPTNEVFLLTLKKQGYVFRLYINNRQIAMTRKSDFQKPTSISFTSGRGGDDYIRVAVYKIAGYYLE